MFEMETLFYEEIEEIYENQSNNLLRITYKLLQFQLLIKKEKEDLNTCTRR